MKTMLLAIGVALVSLASQPVHAQVARPSDKAVAALIKAAQASVKEFTRSLDPDLRRGTVRSADVEVDVENFLSDFATDIERFRKRFKPGYAASAELVTVLRKANDIDAFVRSQSPSFKGRSELDAAAAALQSLAAAYDTTFPAQGEVSARRINDAEIQQAADVVIRNAQTSRRGLKKAYSRDEAEALAAAQKNIAALEKAARALKSRLKSGKPASGEAGVLGEQFAVSRSAITGRSLSKPVSTAWASLEAAVEKIGAAYKISAAGQPAAG